MKITMYFVRVLTWCLHNQSAQWCVQNDTYCCHENMIH